MAACAAAAAGALHTPPPPPRAQDLHASSADLHATSELIADEPILPDTMHGTMPPIGTTCEVAALLATYC